MNHVGYYDNDDLWHDNKLNWTDTNIPSGEWELICDYHDDDDGVGDN